MSNYDTKPEIFTGHVFIFFAFDVGDDINFAQVNKVPDITTQQVHLPKFFKNYHTPLFVELPHPHSTSTCIDSKLHQFGTISLRYKVPFNTTLKELHQELIKIDEKYQEQSITDAYSIYKKIKNCVDKAHFFQLRSYYTVIQVDTKKNLTGPELKEQYSNDIATLLRFETQVLSEFHKEEILESSVGYFKKDLIVIDTEAAFMYDPQYEELLYFFEFGNIQQLELQYFDRLLDQQLTTIYNYNKPRNVPFMSYLPIVGSRYFDPVEELTRLKVDISVITERLENSIKLVGETYYSDIYQLIVEKLDIKQWQDSIENKFNIIKEIRYHYQSKIDATRNDLLSILIIILITLELIIALYK